MGWSPHLGWVEAELGKEGIQEPAQRVFKGTM